MVAEGEGKRSAHVLLTAISGSPLPRQYVSLNSATFLGGFSRASMALLCSVRTPRVPSASLTRGYRSASGAPSRPLRRRIRRLGVASRRRGRTKGTDHS